MATLYLIEQNTILRKRGKRLLICKRPPASRRYSAVLQKDIIRDLPITDVNHVMVFGNVQVTTSALHILLKNGVELAVFTYGGELLGQLTPPLGKNISLRMAQYQRQQDHDFIMRTARGIVAAKIGNALSVLQAYLSNHPGVFDTPELEQLVQLQKRARKAVDLSSLLGIEGAASAHYFSLFSRMILPPYWFSGRSRRPPGDPVNALMSFGYVVIGSQIRSLLDGAGLDPYLGFYHQPEYGRPGLALDLLEEFRHSLVDRLCITLFNKNILKLEDFWNHPGGGVYLNTGGKRTFFTYLEKTLGPPSTSPENAFGAGFRALLQRQVERISNAILENGEYQPYVTGNG